MSNRPIPTPDVKPDEAPRAHLEQELILAYLRDKGHTHETLKQLVEEEAHRLLVEASRYASARLAELEARSRFVSTLHDAGQSVEP